jgi:Raf kinase inhibitor-like YbhB/YbcL family protein
MPFELTSPAFENEGVIPDRFSCKGEDISPELVWGDPPEGTQSFALVFDDPGAPWVHWVVYNLAPVLRGLPEAIPDGETVLDTARHGVNSWGTQDFRGPCPPAGSTHRYVFILYALDSTLNFDTVPDKRQLGAAMEGHILAQVELAANFTR